MIARFQALLALLFIHVTCFSQKDSVAYTGDLKLQDEIYLTYEDFRANKGITKDQIVSGLDKTQLEFISKMLLQERFSYKTDEGQVSMESKNVWGYIQNNTFYINYKGDFYRIPVFGSISYLVANVTIVNPGFYDPRFGYYTGSTQAKEMREFLMNFYDGRIIDFSMDAVEELLSRDQALYGEYKKLSRRKQREQVYKYIRKFNDMHPVYFLNNSGL